MLERLARLVSPRVLRDPRALDEVRAALDDYLAGRRRTRWRGLPVDLALATPFQHEVLPGAGRRSTPYGERTSYGALARSSGGPRPPARSAPPWGRTRCASCCPATGWSPAPER